MQPIPGGTWEIRLGSLLDVTGSFLMTKMRVAAHEFGHFWFGANLPNTSQNPSIMANADTGSVLPSDLHGMVQSCQE
jgi:hypothetical protein